MKTSSLVSHSFPFKIPVNLMRYNAEGKDLTNDFPREGERGRRSPNKSILEQR
jgi:hypothetical protein